MLRGPLLLEVMHMFGQIETVGRHHTVHVRLGRKVVILLRIMELELIEPSLFLDHAPDGGASFTRSILSRARTTTA